MLFSIVRNFIKKLVYKIQLIRIRNKAIFRGSHYSVGPTGSVNLSDGSNRYDIVIGDYVDVYGRITSQNHGKITIGNYSHIGRNARVQSCCKVDIGDYVVVSEDVIITDTNNHPISVNFRKVWAQKPPSSTIHFWKYADNRPVVIRNNVWLGERSRICKGVEIGENSIVAANAVVTKNVPANSIVAGNPAKIVKTGLELIDDPVDCEEFTIFIKEHAEDFQ